jgi:2-hydroxychromene-2-carboxylate isomerase
MSSITVTYTHAAPYIRERLVQSVLSGTNAKTQRDTVAGFREAFAYGQALKIMAASGDQAPVEGVYQLESFTQRDLGRVRKFLGDDANFELIMGIPTVEPWED